MSDTPDIQKEEQPVTSPERRTLLKKVAYVAPAVMVLGAISPITKYAAASPGPAGGNGGPPCGPGPTSC